MTARELESASTAEGAALQRIRRGSFADGPVWAQADDATRHRALILDVMGGANGSAVVSHVSAAVLHDLSLPAWTDLRKAHITWPGARGRRTTTNVVPHRSRLDPEDIVTVGGVRVTSVARTIYDLARGLGAMAAVTAADSALREQKASRERFDDLCSRMQGRPGSVAAAQVMGFADGRSVGPGPSQARVLLARIGLPAPDLAVTVHHPTYGELEPLDFRFRGLHTTATWEDDAVDGLCRRLAPLTATLAELRIRHLFIGPADLASPRAVLARFRRTFSSGTGPTAWNRRTPLFLAGPGG